MDIIAWDGNIITKPGIYSGVPIEVYHSQRICDGPSVSSSGLRRALEVNGGSPAHFYAEWSGNPNAIETADKKHFVLGRAAHHLLLGQPNFARLFCIRPEELPDPKTGEMRAWQGNRTVCKEWLERATARRLTVLTPEDVVDIIGMSTAIGRHPLAGDMLRGYVECSIFWKDEETDIWFKSRPDAIPTDSGDAADLKTTTSTYLIDLMRAISDYAYHQQAALVREGIEKCAGIKLASFSLIFVEKKNPWCARVVIMKDKDIDLGAQQNRDSIKLIARCIRDNRWPGPGDDDIREIDLTEVYKSQANKMLEANRGIQDG